MMIAAGNGLLSPYNGDYFLYRFAEEFCRGFAEEISETHNQLNLLIK